MNDKKQTENINSICISPHIAKVLQRHSCEYFQIELIENDCFGQSITVWRIVDHADENIVYLVKKSEVSFFEHMYNNSQIYIQIDTLQSHMIESEFVSALVRYSETGRLRNDDNFCVIAIVQ